MSENLFAVKDPYFAAAQEDRSAPRTRVSIPATMRISGEKPSGKLCFIVSR